MQGKRPPQISPPPDAKRLWRDFQDHEIFCRESLKIRDKRGTAVPFILQPAQRKLHEAIAECRRRGRPVRIIYLKARQVMVSSGIAAEFFHQVPFQLGQKARIVAHCEDSAKLIFGYYHQLHESYEPFRGAATLPACTKDAEDKGILEYAGGSAFQIQTANSVEAGRGGSFRYLHLSEYPFWRNARKLMRGLMQSVPDDPDTMVIIEGTANGVGDDFHQRWQEACDPQSGSEWLAVFFAWWEHPEYLMAVPDPAAFQASLDEDEQLLAQKFGLSLEQLCWRRWCIKNKCKSSIDTFKQEYPSEPSEAFLFSGRPRFSHKHLARMPIIEDPLVGELEVSQEGPKAVIRFLPSDERGALSVFRKPTPGHSYVIGVDVAEGIDRGDGDLGGSDPDFSVADVLDRANGEQVAQLRGRIEPGPFGEYLALLAQWYHWAFLVPEANGPGIALMEELIRQNYPPNLIYHRQPTAEDMYSPDASGVLSKLGWKTTNVTRPQLLSNLDQWIRRFEIVVRSRGTLEELQTFVIKGNGRAEATDGCHDDRVISLALAGTGLRFAPTDRPKPPADLPRKMTPGGVTDYGKRHYPDRGVRVRL